ncbi:MAG TPA: hypothetical protein VLZ05_14615 [Mycobacterium sp.]|nr:hypothetical protein [Mycobacterium sp.]HUH69971.1 hypothetical protein [Mycobacterium sp.]
MSEQIPKCVDVHVGVGEFGCERVPCLRSGCSNGRLIEVADAKTFVALDNPDAVIDAIAAITAQ